MKTELNAMYIKFNTKSTTAVHSERSNTSLAKEQFKTFSGYTYKTANFAQSRVKIA